MTQFLISLIPASLFIYAVHILFQEDHLLEKQGDWITEKLGDKWSKPIINCPICMSSFWGTIWFWTQTDYGWRQYFLWVMCLCGLNYIINKLISKEISIKELNEKAEETTSEENSGQEANS